MPAVVPHVRPADIASVQFYGVMRRAASAKPLAAYDLDVMFAQHAAELRKDCACAAIGEDGVRRVVREVNDGDDETRVRSRYLRIAVIRFAHPMRLPIGTDSGSGTIVSLIMTTPPLLINEPTRTAIWVGRRVTGRSGPTYQPVFVTGDPLHMDGGDHAIPHYWYYFQM